MKSRRTATIPKLVVVIDDDPLVLEATGGLLRSWGCRVVTAETYEKALEQLKETRQRPDLIICDYRLPGGATGVDAIEGLRSAFEIPALLISGDASSPTSKRPSDYRLLHKPVDETTFRAALMGTAVFERQHQER